MIGPLALEVLYLNDYKAYSDDVAHARLNKTLADLDRLNDPGHIMFRRIMRDLEAL